MGTRENVKITRKAAENTYLVLLQPLLKQLLPSLLQDGARQFDGFEVVELPLLEQDAEVLQDRRQPSWRCRRCLEGLDDLRGTQDALDGVI